MSLNRRSFLTGAAALGCSAAASPLVTPMAFAAAPWDSRLVVVILRGGMDGLDVVRPLGDREFAALRGADAGAGSQDLDGFFALHPALSGLMPLWQAGDLAFAHAVSTPYRDRRSHFDGQDLLEAGAGFAEGAPLPRDGWLNRMLQVVPGVEAETAFAIGREDLRVLSGAAPVSNWAPDTRLGLSPQAELLLTHLYEGDPLFEPAAAEAIALSAATSGPGPVPESDPGMMAMSEMASDGPGRGHLQIAEFAVERLRGDARVAAFSLNGWDTHARQHRSLPRALGQLSDVVRALHLGLGPVWEKTAVVAMTEFGRTARRNGTDGTDHGTGGAMLLAGGAIRGGVVHADWPGLAEGGLYDRRDLMPTADVRAYAAAVMQGLIGLDRAALEEAIFPGLRMEGLGRVTL
jgi:uncharacterized protein (DUF1501 family)